MGVRVEGTVSQNFVLGLSFYFMPKNGKHFIHNFEYFVLYFTEKEPGPISKI